VIDNIFLNGVEMPRRIAIVGAGMAGLSCASRLRQRGHEVVILEKSRGVSGRISTRTLAHGACDHGAQYITATSSDFQEELNRWKEKGLIELWQPRIRVIGGERSSDPISVDRYVGTPRMTSPLNALSETLDVRRSVKVQSLEHCQEGWVIKSEEGAAFEQSFDTIIFAIPAPQVVQLLGSIVPRWRESVTTVKMLPCWAVMATLVENQETPFDAAFVNSGPLAWIANNASKPGRWASPLWTLHANADWTLEHLNDDPKNVTQGLTEAFESITHLKVSEAIAHRWLYAKADPNLSQGYLWDPDLRMAACGDWLSSGNVEGAWKSGQACAEAIAC
jgi:renalase